MVLNTEDLDSKPLPAVPSTKNRKRDDEGAKDASADNISLRELYAEMI